MKHMMQKRMLKSTGWLLFFYSVPSRPVGARVRIWRKLIKAGSLPFKGAVYILPDNEENFEYFQWLVSEVTSMGGEAAFVKVEKLETAKDNEIIGLFNQQRARDYHGIEKGLEEIERRTDSLKKGGNLPRGERLLGQFHRLMKKFDEIKRIDFFSSRIGDDLKGRMKVIEPKVRTAAAPDAKEPLPVIAARTVEDYKGKTWVTRKNPFVDRMATAWLIRKFIDKKAVFQFMDEKMMEKVKEDFVAFDVRGGEFTHVGDMCTFEVLLKSFKFKDKALKKMAEIVHELDVKDDRFHNPESRGIEEILIGIRKTARSDKEILEKGMALFDMVYSSKT